MEIEEENVELVPVVQIGAPVEPIVEEVPAANGNKRKNHSSASSLRPRKRFSHSRDSKSKSHDHGDGVVRRSKRLVEAGFSNIKINVDDSDESDTSDVHFKRLTSKSKKPISSSNEIPKESKPLKSILKSRLKNPISNNRSSNNPSVNPLRVRFRERFANKIQDNQNNVKDLMIVDQVAVNVREDEGEAILLEQPFFRRPNEAAMQALRSISNDIIIWMRLNRQTQKHAMVHLSANFPTNLIGDSAIRWTGIDPEVDNEIALIRKYDEPEEEINTMLDHATFKIHSLTRLYKISMYPNEKDCEFPFHANVYHAPRKGYVPHFATERIQLGEDWLYAHLRTIDLANRKIILENDFNQLVKFNFEKRIKRRDRDNYYEHRGLPRQ